LVVADQAAVAVVIFAKKVKIKTDSESIARSVLLKSESSMTKVRCSA
jgi:hypothetical protein